MKSERLSGALICASHQVLGGSGTGEMQENPRGRRVELLLRI